MQFGKVYKGLWQGQEVAVKSMVLPLTMLGTEKRECMAVMEAAISSSLRHPNIVQVWKCGHISVRVGGGGAVMEATVSSSLRNIVQYIKCG